MLSKDFGSTPDINSISVVNEYVDVFSEDVTSLRLECEVEFFMDLVSGTWQIYVALYRISMLALKELKAQLEDFIQKHFIRPIVSPWGAPVLLIKKKDGGMRLCID